MWRVAVYCRTFFRPSVSRSREKVKFRRIFSLRSVAVLSRTRFCSHPNLLAGFLFSTAFITLRLHAAMLHRLRDFSGQISIEIDRFCADLMFFFFLPEIIICYFNNKALQNWASGKAFNTIVPSFSQHNVRLVVLERCSLIVHVLMTFTAIKPR